MKNHETIGEFNSFKKTLWRYHPFKPWIQTEIEPVTRVFSLRMWCVDTPQRFMELVVLFEKMV